MVLHPLAHRDVHRGPDRPHRHVPLRVHEPVFTAGVLHPLDHQLHPVELHDQHGVQQEHHCERGRVLRVRHVHRARDRRAHRRAAGQRRLARHVPPPRILHQHVG